MGDNQAPEQNEQRDLMTLEEAAAEIFNTLTTDGYTLASKADICKQLRKLVRTEAEAQQKEISNLIDSL
ncbi:hypothetical protein [Spirosoma pomorum]